MDEMPLAGSDRATLVASNLGQMLLRRALITPEQLTAATAGSVDAIGGFAAALVRLGIFTDEQLSAALHREYRLPIIDLKGVEPPSEILTLVPDSLVQKHTVLPIRRDGSVLTLVMADPADLVAITEVKFLTGCDVRVVLAPIGTIEKAIERLYKTKEKATRDAISQLRETTSETSVIDQVLDIAALERVTSEAPIVKLVGAILREATDRRASDIHFEPYDHRFRVRFRIDGMLYDVVEPPAAFRAAIVSRIKVMSSLDISEKRLPQDGALKLRLSDGRETSFRVSVIPTLFGEKVVLRLMDKSSLRLGLTELGFEPVALAEFRRAIERPHGMVLVTGPTGSGKSTTLYSALTELNQSFRNISTAEDPIELDIAGVNQLQVHEDIGLTFAAALRAFLRQDPDVIMVGEIRDRETADISVKAALTGHLVLSTLHTNDAPSTMNRLLDMGIEPFLIASSVNLVVAQRLVRLLCPVCKAPDNGSRCDALVEIGFSPAEAREIVPWRGVGCDECARTGYHGRVAIYEVMPVSEAIRSLVVRRASATEVRERAAADGMRGLVASGMEKVRQGVTTIEEVLRVASGD